MKVLKNVYSNIKVYIFTIFVVSLAFILSAVLIDNYRISKELDKTFQNSTCDFVAYDNFYENDNCYGFYSNNKVDVYIVNQDNLLNVSVYQFIKDNTYTDKSLFNRQNVISGDYKELESREVALSKSVADRYGLLIADYIYIDGVKCTIKFIYNDVYEIINFDTKGSVHSILVGANTINKNCEMYCNFDPSDETHHVHLYNISKNKQSVEKERNLYEMLIIVLSFILYMFISSFKLKSEKLMLKNAILSGEDKLITKVLIIELSYVLPTIIVLTSLMLWNKFVYCLPLLIIGCSIAVIVNILRFFLYIRRLKYGGYK